MCASDSSEQFLERQSCLVSAHVTRTLNNICVLVLYKSTFYLLTTSLCAELQLDVEALMRLVDACCPDWYQSLCDSDTPRHASLKRVRRAVDRTITYLDKCLDIQTTLPVSRVCQHWHWVSRVMGSCSLTQSMTQFYYFCQELL